jgi:pimeloyl-ACP methyl ester carboxylesterase
LHRDNPHRLLRRRQQPCVILHDELDRLVPIAQSRAAADENPRVALQPTRDLGHTRILRSDSAIAALNGYLLEPLSKAS